jgi:Zn-finger nucleic acid-binding protein
MFPAPMTPLCPLDQQALQAIPHGAAFYYSCPACHGHWLERQFLNILTEKRRPKEAVKRAEPISNRSSALACPACRMSMLHRTMGKVQIDLCAECKSVWLDGGEIDLLAAGLPKQKLGASLDSSIESVLLQPVIWPLF